MANYLGSAIGFLAALPVKTTADVRPLLYWEAAASVFIFVLAAMDHCWPALPPLPPSASSAIESGNSSSSKSPTVWELLSEMMALLKNGQFMLLTLVFGITIGTMSGWSGVLNPILAPLGFTQVRRFHINRITIWVNHFHRTSHPGLDL
jgi:hypothetical protein